MAQAISHTPGALWRLGFQTSPCGICGRQSGNWTDISPSTSVFVRVGIMPTMLHIHLFNYLILVAGIFVILRT